MNVVLVDPPMSVDAAYGQFREWADVTPPTGLCYIAGLARARSNR